jgi:hypothetical protein
MSALKQLKCELYATLLLKEDPTESEVKIMYELCMDSEVRKVLDEGMAKRREEMQRGQG